jgi:hypothetical protein
MQKIQNIETFFEEFIVVVDEAIFYSEGTQCVSFNVLQCIYYISCTMFVLLTSTLLHYVFKLTVTASTECNS